MEELKNTDIAVDNKVVEAEVVETAGEVKQALEEETIAAPEETASVVEETASVEEEMEEETEDEDEDDEDEEEEKVDLESLTPEERAERMQRGLEHIIEEANKKKKKKKKRKNKKFAITVKDLHISYRDLKKVTLKQMIFSKDRSKVDYFEAVKGVTFQVRQGNIVGIIGKNGSGKSTLLRALAGIFSPDEGTIDMHGNTVSLLAIGVGFQKELTGRENIYLSGMLLGFDRSVIKAKEKAIIEFSELGPFIDKPVRTYSSGMHSKLAFSITAVLETDIMLIDEVLSVGDQRFKKKSFNKMKELIQDETRTVVIVSHNISTLRKLCKRVIWMHEGNIVLDGSPKRVLGAYKQFMEEEY